MFKKISLSFLSLLTLMQVFAGNVFATAPASLAEACSVSIDETVVWTAMAAVLAIVGGIVAYKYVRRLMH